MAAPGMLVLVRAQDGFALGLDLRARQHDLLTNLMTERLPVLLSRLDEANISRMCRKRFRAATIADVHSCR
jgi:hypothetical protein